LLVLVLFALGAVFPQAAAAAGPEIQKLPVDQTIDSPFSGTCGFDIQDHDVGTLKYVRHADGRVVTHVNLRTTSTRVSTGEKLSYTTSLKFTDTTVTEQLQPGEHKITTTSIANGLNYRVVGPGGPFVSAGRAVITTTYTFVGDVLVDLEVDEVSTPRLEHLTSILCSALSGRAFGRGSISGRVTSERTGAPREGVCVVVYDGSSGDFLGFDISRADGTYAVKLLPRGSFKVRFVECDTDEAHFEEWYRNKEGFDTADTVRVSGAQAVRRIDAALEPLPTVSGTVTDEATGEPIAGVFVVVFLSDPNGGGYQKFTLTDEQGHYSVRVLPGPYQVQFDPDPPYAYEVYNDEPSTPGDIFTVSRGSDVSGIDASLLVGGAISGTVTNQAGEPLGGVCVSALNDAQHGSVGFAQTESDGTYTMHTVRPGQWKVHFQDCSTFDYVSQFFDHVTETGDFGADFAAATRVSVASATTTPGIDASLVVGNTIGGRVTDETTGSEPIDVCVFVIRVLPGGAYDGQLVSTNEVDGRWGLGGLLPGEYKVSFDDCSSDDIYKEEWYDNKASFETADVIKFASYGQVISGIDAGLARHFPPTPVPGITGTVTDASTGEPISIGCAMAFDAVTEQLVSFDDMRADGKYQLGFNPEQTDREYKVRFGPCGLEEFPYIEEWYNDKPDIASADPVAVVGDNLTRGIDAALSR
jgi:hypothetical protein